MKSKLKKRLEEKIASLHESSLRSLHACESPSLRSSSSSRSTCSTSRHQMSSSSRSKDLFREQASDTSFEPMLKFHDGPIFDQDNDEDMDAYHSLEKQQKDSRHTSNRTFAPLEDSYDDTLQKLLGNKIIMLPKSSSYGNPFLDIYCAYHQHNEHSTSDCIELKYKIQDLIDNRIIDTSNDSSTHSLHIQLHIMLVCMCYLAYWL